jgi:hypothetical protein
MSNQVTNSIEKNSDISAWVADLINQVQQLNKQLHISNERIGRLENIIIQMTKPVNEYAESNYTDDNPRYYDKVGTWINNTQIRNMNPSAQVELHLEQQHWTCVTVLTKRRLATVTFKILSNNPKTWKNKWFELDINPHNWCVLPSVSVEEANKKNFEFQKIVEDSINKINLESEIKFEIIMVTNFTSQKFKDIIIPELESESDSDDD